MDFTQETKMDKNKIIIFVVIGVLVLYFGMGKLKMAGETYCYQESANKINQMGTDGSCNQQYTGTYIYGRNIAKYDCPTPEFNGQCDYNRREGDYLHVTYAKPATVSGGAAVTGATWKVKDIAGTTTYTPDLAIPTTCFNAFTNKIELRIFSDFSNTAFECYTGTGTTWQTLVSYTGSTSGNFYCSPPHTNASLDGAWTTYEHYHGSGCYKWGSFDSQNQGIYDEAMSWTLCNPQCTNPSTVACGAAINPTNGCGTCASGTFCPSGYCNSGSCITCRNDADNNPCNGKVSDSELIAYAQKWIANQITDTQLLQVAQAWLNG